MALHWPARPEVFDTYWELAKEATIVAQCGALARTLEAKGAG
jgi:hypothetical protein